MSLLGPLTSSNKEYFARQIGDLLGRIVVLNGDHCYLLFLKAEPHLRLEQNLLSNGIRRHQTEVYDGKQNVHSTQ